MHFIPGQGCRVNGELLHRRLPQIKVAQASSVWQPCTVVIKLPRCSTKFAVEGLSEALALTLPKTGVRVTLVEPGATQTVALQRAVHMLEQVMLLSLHLEN